MASRPPSPARAPVVHQLYTDSRSLSFDFWMEHAKLQFDNLKDKLATGIDFYYTYIVLGRESKSSFAISKSVK